MKEAAYNSTLASKIEKEIGGKVYKISDQSTLGLPDSLHIMDGLASFIECKIGKCNQTNWVEPLKAIKDIRQYEVCRQISKNALVLYAIYYPEIRAAAVIPIDILHRMKNSEEQRLFFGQYLTQGHGVDLIAEFLKGYREDVIRALTS